MTQSLLVLSYIFCMATVALSASSRRHDTIHDIKNQLLKELKEMQNYDLHERGVPEEPHHGLLKATLFHELNDGAVHVSRQTRDGADGHKVAVFKFEIPMKLALKGDYSYIAVNQPIVELAFSVETARRFELVLGSEKVEVPVGEWGFTEKKHPVLNFSPVPITFDSFIGIDDETMKAGLERFLSKKIAELLNITVQDSIEHAMEAESPVTESPSSHHNPQQKSQHIPTVESPVPNPTKPDKPVSSWFWQPFQAVSKFVGDRLPLTKTKKEQLPKSSHASALVNLWQD